MKRLLYIGFLLSSLVSMQVHAIRHSLTNESNKTIDVFMWLHGESMLGKNAQNCLESMWTSCCRREKRDLKPGERVEWDTKGCQLKKIRVEEVGTGKKVTVNVQNASKTVAKNTAAGAAVLAISLASVDSASKGNYGSAYAGHVVASDIADQDYTTKELVAYGSTSWVYDNEGIKPVSGVKMYGK